MTNRIEKISVIIISTPLLIGLCEAGDYGKYGQTQIAESNQTGQKELTLLSDVYAGIEAAGVVGGDYRLKTARQLQFDILNVKEWFLHFKIQENDLFDYSPAQIDHTIGYIAAGYETADGRFSLFWDHTCNNPTRLLPQSNTIRWNEIGIGYETTGIRFGHENDGIAFDDDFQRLYKLNWRFLFSKVWMKTDNDYDYMFKLGLREDILRIRNHVFYVQFNLDTIYDDRGVNFNPLIEAGDRILLNRNVSLIPFISYERFNDWYGLDDDEEFFFYGLRLQAALGPDSSLTSYLEEKKSRKNSVFSSGQVPLRFHIIGGYNTNLQGSHKSCRSSDLYLDLDLLEFDDDKTFILNTYAGILTPSGGFNVQNVNYKIGPSLKIDLPDYYLRLFHTYSCLYGFEHPRVIGNYNLLGAQIGKDEQLSWALRAGVFPTTTNFDFSSLLLATMDYDFLAGGTTPYITGSLVYLIGDDPVTGNAVEGGLKIPGKAGSFVIYLRQEDSFDVFRFGRGEQRWLGIRLVF